jgi:hypothetical protein
MLPSPGMPPQTCLEMAPHAVPLGGQDRIHNVVTHAPVTPQGVTAEPPVPARTQGLNGPLRPEVHPVRAKAHDAAAEGLKGIP